jgi:hypothetical protein
MRKFHASAALIAALVLITSHDGQVLAASPNDPQTPEKTVPQGTDPPGADNEDQSNATTKHKGVIKPPQTGDEGIYTQAPNPDAGTEEEVIPPPGTPGSEHPNVEPR